MRPGEVKRKDNPYFAIKHKRLARRRGKKKASICRVIRTSKPFHPSGYELVVNGRKKTQGVVERKTARQHRSFTVQELMDVFQAGDGMSNR